jgi:shikimate dehydrogenase
MTFEVEPPRLGDAMRGIRALGIHGVKIGEPFQEVVLDHLDSLSDRAKPCGSVNCVTSDGNRLIGDNTEGAALVELLRLHVNLVGRRVTILGAGRIARAIALALAAAGASAIAIASRSAERGERLVELLQQHTTSSATVLDVNKAAITLEPENAVLVNATSQSTLDPTAKLPLDPASLGQKLIVADVTYNTARTWLTRQAAQRGCRTIDGLAIYVQQTALALEAWTGVMPDTNSMREAAEEFLGI